jgi:nucleoside-diphosphate-sugar epimerase
VVIKKRNVLVIGNGYVASSLKYDNKKKFNIFLLSKNKLDKKKKFKNIDLLIHPVGLNRHRGEINAKKAILIKKKYTYKIINFAKKNNIKKIIYLSTAHVYSKNLFGIINEKTKCTNISTYAKSHLLAENILEKNANSDLKITIIRLSNLFGIRYLKNNTQFKLVINQFLKQAITNKKIIVRDKYAIRDFIPMNYFIKILPKLFFSNNKFKIVNVGYRSYNLQYIARFISKRIKKLFNFDIKIILNTNNSKKIKLLYKSILNKKKPSYFFLRKEIDNSLKILIKNK